MSGEDIAIVHKHYPERGGAEIVADELARTFDAPIFTGYEVGDASSDDVEVRELFDGHISKLFRKDWGLNWLVRDAFYTFGWDYQPEVAEYDTLVQSGCAPMWYVPRDDQTVIRYIHSTPRTPFDLYHGDDAGAAKITRAYAKVVRTLTHHTIPFADLYVANSEVVAKRMQKYWGVDEKDIRIVYPPVDVDEYDYHPGAGDDYYVALSRLDPAKGFGLIIDAFRHLGLPLKIVGDGRHREALESRAEGADNITFEGFVPEARKRELLQNANAMVYAAKNEDFGMVPIESFAAGTPVIGVDEGFTKHQITDGETGVTYKRDVGDLVRAVEHFEANGVSADPAALHQIAQQCSTDRFRAKMRAVVGEARERAAVTAPSWDTGSDAVADADVEELVADGGDV